MTYDNDYEELSLFSLTPEEEEPAHTTPIYNVKENNSEYSAKTAEPQKTKGWSTEKPETKTPTTPQEVNPPKQRAETEIETTHLPTWEDYFVEYDITHTMQAIKDNMKERLLAKGLTKREANRFFKGLFFKEKVWNTKEQAKEMLRTIPTTYAVKYKIGIDPSPKMLSLEKRLHQKEKQWATFQQKQAEKLKVSFLTCTHCKSKVNLTYATPPTCPVCGKDMRSPSVITKEEKLSTAVTSLRKRYEDAARLHHSHFTGGEKWILRIVNPFATKDE